MWRWAKSVWEEWASWPLLLLVLVWLYAWIAVILVLVTMSGVQNPPGWLSFGIPGAVFLMAVIAFPGGAIVLAILGPIFLLAPLWLPIQAWLERRSTARRSDELQAQRAAEAARQEATLRAADERHAAWEAEWRRNDRSVLASRSDGVVLARYKHTGYWVESRDGQRRKVLLPEAISWIRDSPRDAVQIYLRVPGASAFDRAVRKAGIEVAPATDGAPG